MGQGGWAEAEEEQPKEKEWSPRGKSRKRNFQISKKGLNKIERKEIANKLQKCLENSLELKEPR